MNVRAVPFGREPPSPESTLDGIDGIPLFAFLNSKERLCISPSGSRNNLAEMAAESSDVQAPRTSIPVSL